MALKTTVASTALADWAEAPGFTIAPPARSDAVASAATLAAAGVLVAACLLSYVPAGADLSQITFVGGLLTGACLIVISVATLFAALKSGDPYATNISLLGFLALLAVAGAITGLQIGSFAMLYGLVPIVYVLTMFASSRLRRAN